MNVLSLFDGISCGRVALERVGIKVDKYFASEIKPEAIRVTMENYPDTIQLGDVRNIKGLDLPRIDLLMGGPPCQDLSGANNAHRYENRDIKKRGLEGGKSNLFYEYVRLKNEINPTYFLLENVGSMDSDESLKISEALGTHPVRINSSFVSAQLRDRLYWTNIEGECVSLFGREICQPKDIGITLQSILTSGYADREKARCILESDSRPLVTPEKMWHRYFETRFTTLVFESFDCDWRNGIRYLNQTELERCQTLPEGYTKVLKRNDAAGCIGDGWTVDIIAHIFKPLLQPPTDKDK